MSEQLNEATQKKMKHMFLIFLKQFQVNEYRYLMIFLQSVINKYNVSPSKLFSKNRFFFSCRIRFFYFMIIFKAF